MNSQLGANEFAVEDNGDMTVRLSDRKILHGQNLDILGQIFQVCRCKRLVLNCGDVRFFSNTALSKLLALNRLVQAEGGRLVLYNLSPDLREVFEITKIDRVFHIHHDEEVEDVRAFRQLSYA